jgi:hypothetical protein
MKSQEILNQLFELKQCYRNQNLTFSDGQKKTYENLMNLRRERVRYFYENDMVCKVSKSAQDKLRDAADN